MPYKLNTLIKKTEFIRNPSNRKIVNEFLHYMTERESSVNHQINNLKVIISFANYLGLNTTFHDVNKKEQILQFLDLKKNTSGNDVERKWITTWNYYLNRIKLFYRWLYNKDNDRFFEMNSADLETPEFVRIKTKKTKRLSPYSVSELWEKDDILLITKYESYKRNKAILTLLWDLDARNHEITLLKIKHVRLLENYGEGEIPHEAKTGTGPILLTCSFPYVRDWLNEHPFRNESDARLICNLHNGAPVNPESIWTIMKQLRARIIRLLENGEINNRDEREKLQYLLKTKKWNPYCIRHSAITSDSDFLPEYALKKKVRWSMNSKQGSRYIKRRMGNELKQKILEQNGIITPQAVTTRCSVLMCPRCGLTNAIENQYCSKCSYPLVPSAFEVIKNGENMRFQALEQKYEKEMEEMREYMEGRFQQILEKVDLVKLERN